MKVKIKVSLILLLSLMIQSCGLVPMDYNRGGGQIYGKKICEYHYGVGKNGMYNIHKKGIQQYCGVKDLADTKTDLRTLKYETCNSCDEFMAKLGYSK